MAVKYRKKDFLISTDKSLLDLKVIHNLFTASYWAKNVSYTIVEKAIEESLCFGVYHQHKQIGFARVITDFATIAYISDVFILDEYKERKLLDWLMMCILSHPELQTPKRWFLASKEGLYAQCTFTPLNTPPHVDKHARPSA